MDVNARTENCPKKQLNQGIIVPECPPPNEIELTLPNNYADFFIIARGSRGEPEMIGKATLDLLFDNGGS